ncbi:Uncharacterized protein Rs2_03228 [Raphanus sativus]|nr:Uncharacterized protein Rs2_03228 [Raphanus sativus]
MKRKGDHSSCDKENERPSKSVEKNRNNQNNCLQSQSSSTRQRLAEEDVRSSVEMTSVFKRLFGALEKHQINTKNASVRDHLRSTPNTPRNICRKTFDQANKTPDQRSCFMSLKSQVSCSTKANTTQRPIDQNKRNNKRMALDDITNSADKEGLYTTTPRTPKRRCVSMSKGVCLDSDQPIKTPYQSSCVTSLKSLRKVPSLSWMKRVLIILLVKKHVLTSIKTREKQHLPKRLFYQEVFDQ